MNVQIGKSSRIDGRTKYCVAIAGSRETLVFVPCKEEDVQHCSDSCMAIQGDLE